MDKLREWSFPAVVLTLWALVSAYTIAELGAAHEAAVRAQAPAAEPAVEIEEPVTAAELSLSH